MRTTLDIESDVLRAAKEIAVKEKSTAGAIISQLARKGLAARNTVSSRSKLRNGVPMLPKRGEIVTLEHVRRIMEEENM